MKTLHFSKKLGQIVKINQFKVTAVYSTLCVYTTANNITSHTTSNRVTRFQYIYYNCIIQYCVCNAYYCANNTSHTTTAKHTTAKHTTAKRVHEFNKFVSLLFTFRIICDSVLSRAYFCIQL